MKALSPDRERIADYTLAMIPRAIEDMQHLSLFVNADIKLRELEKTADISDTASGYKYSITDTSVLKSESIARIVSASGLAVPVYVSDRSLTQVCRKYDRGIVICDINAIVPGGGFRVGDSSNESQVCLCSTLYQQLNTKIAKMRYYFNNATTGRWAQDAVVLVPDVGFFSGKYAGIEKRHTVLGISPPNMTVTSTQLKLSPATSNSFRRRVLDAFALAQCLSGESCAGRVLIVPVLGYKTFSIPIRLCCATLVDAINNISTAAISRIVLVFDDETSVLQDAIVSRLQRVEGYDE